RFIGELPVEVLTEVRLGSSSGLSMFNSSDESSSNDTGLNLGQRVSHVKFGEGVVLNLEGKGSNARVHVNFEEIGSKWLVLAYANLQTEF
ncbi:MAG: DNA helicase II, partial [Gammaproteobacteria bacterium]